MVKVKFYENRDFLDLTESTRDRRPKRLRYLYRQDYYYMTPVVRINWRPLHQSFYEDYDPF